MPKPTKLALMTADDKKKFFELLQRGVPQNWACKAIRFSYDTLDDYRKRAAAGEEPFASFIRDVEQAQATWVCGRLQILDADSVGAPPQGNRERCDPKTLTWMLERLHPKDFAPLQKNEHTGKDGVPLEAGTAKVILMPPKDPE